MSTKRKAVTSPISPPAKKAKLETGRTVCDIVMDQLLAAVAVPGDTISLTFDKDVGRLVRIMPTKDDCDKFAWQTDSTLRLDGTGRYHCPVTGIYCMQYRDILAFYRLTAHVAKPGDDDDKQPEQENEEEEEDDEEEEDEEDVDYNPDFFYDGEDINDKEDLHTDAKKLDKDDLVSLVGRLQERIRCLVDQITDLTAQKKALANALDVSTIGHEQMTSHTYEHF